VNGKSLMALSSISDVANADRAVSWTGCHGLGVIDWVGLNGVYWILRVGCLGGMLLVSSYIGGARVNEMRSGGRLVRAWHLAISLFVPRAA